MCSCWSAFGSALGRCVGKHRDNGSVTPSTDHPDSPAEQTPQTQRKKSFSSSDVLPSTPRSGDEILRQSSGLRVFSFGDLKSATRNFRPDSWIGEGGFGHVFKGWIDENGTAAVRPGSGLTVAVKQLNPEGFQGHREWLAEVNFLGQLHHFNLVKLIGYCAEDEHRLLVYEFMPRGSLENHLFRKGSLPLTWAIRMKVALGAAQGLAFLHREAVIYRDFKTSNILLDHDYTAKLSDFGLAKDGPEGDKTHVSTRIMGTYGYAAPEYVMTGHLTARSDVYSFGVVFLEMLTGRRSMDKSRPTGEHNLVEWARPYLHDKRRIFRLVDPKLDGQCPMKAFQKAAQLAAACLSRDAKSRPDMKEIVRHLEPLQVTSDITGQLQPLNYNTNPYPSSRPRPLIVNGNFSHHGNNNSPKGHTHHHRNGFPSPASGGGAPNQQRYQASPRRSPARFNRR
ncbi:hypothetical protein SELMODRAFT_151233 [Selaginella moellendorffii]|uniref:non-specific serine/threonine protein kinase n=1 Tax=Selaginella moellendorffii TaxID=88036 RepID=D8RZA1_SELML|nr:probable serine/threonine-protein kinase PBL11 [Selaginella moellendorffii]EFJ22709.1 hypothetical protein SELMODRAFT_151233 [Selaginella moellendorffii]|eukprot:XP_002976449.1 probable serine/threonine-protein kinase PBL11 [Selaginella moellendorffii]